MSWNLSPQDLIDEAYIPSLWRTQQHALRCLLAAVFGSLLPAALLSASPAAYRRLAHTRRRRRPHICYPIRR